MALINITLDLDWIEEVESRADDIRTDFINGDMTICEDFHDLEKDAENINQILSHFYHCQTGPSELLIPFNAMVERVTKARAEKLLESK